MVWGLFPVDPQSGEDKYYIFKPGTYKVGRKGCDVIITKDKGVSRIHAEITIDAMTSTNGFQKIYSDVSSKVQIRDCSKYGTFISRNFASKEKVHESPNKETTLKEGDLVSFGTGSACYRFCFVPLVFFLHCREPSQLNYLLEDKVSLIGAGITPNWNEECTHVLIDELMPVTEDLLEAIAAKKPFALSSWLEFVAEKSVRTEIPSCSLYLPTLSVEGVSAKVADPRTRENCLEGYTFLMEAAYSYFSRYKLQPLLEAGGAKVLSVESFHSSSQGSNYEDNSHVVCVIPKGAAGKFEHFNKCSSLSRVNEIDLICAVLSGHLDPALLISPCVIVSSSCSTDETVVADSDTEAETATSDHATVAVCAKEASACDIKAEISMDHVVTISEDDYSAKYEDNNKSIPARRNKLDEPEAEKMDIIYSTKCEDTNESITARRDKIDESEAGNMDIIYSQDLIVQSLNLVAVISSAAKDNVLNFKRFKKTNTPSGNSFNNLIPFSKYPYKDSEYGNEEMAESMKEEKKRKQMEAVAEDLFNNEKGRRRGVAGSLQGLLTRG